MRASRKSWAVWVVVGTVMALSACSDSDPPLNFTFNFSDLEQDPATGALLGDGVVFPEGWILPLDELPGVETEAGVIDLKVRGVFFSPCAPRIILAEADLTSDRIALRVIHVDSDGCAGDPVPIAYEGVWTLLPGGTYDLEVIYENTALVFGMEFSSRISVHQEQVFITGVGD